jgi:hypothetical protein
METRQEVELELSGLENGLCRGGAFLCGGGQMPIRIYPAAAPLRKGAFLEPSEIIAKEGIERLQEVEKHNRFIEFERHWL